MIRFGSAIALVVGVAVGVAEAQEATPTELVGVWKRLGNKETRTERFYNLKLKDGALVGELLNPPFDTMSCSLELKVSADRVEGKCHWTEGKHKTHTKWNFTVNRKRTRLLGQSELIDWEDGKVYDRRWVDYTLVRVEKDQLVAALKKAGKKNVSDFPSALKVLGYEVEGLVTEGEAEETYGDSPKNLSDVAGGYAGPGGAWSATVQGKALTVSPVGHHDKWRMELKDERGTLKGHVTMASGRKAKIELAWDADESTLAGRVEWMAGPYGNWAPIKMTRLKRTEAGAASAEKPTSSKGPLTGVWKRDDGLYLRVREEAGDTLGVLSKKDGKPVARVRFKQESGIWVGTANWEGWESTWELGVDGDTLKGRCQWADVHDGKVVARGWGGRTFSRLKRAD